MILRLSIIYHVYGRSQYMYRRGSEQDLMRESYQQTQELDKFVDNQSMFMSE